MPVLRYFLMVRVALLAILFLIDAYVPSQALVAVNAAPSVDKSVVRIRSDQKLPEKVVYDTSLPTIVPPASTVQGAVAPQPPVVGEVSAQVQVRDTYAQYVAAELKKHDPQVQRKRRVSRTHASPPVRLAEQAHFGFFGGPNNTW